MINAVRFSKLKSVKEIKIDPTFIDPIGNNLLHFAILNPNFGTFFYLAKILPESALNKQDQFGSTPLHKIKGKKYYKMKWEKLWNLSWDYSIRDKHNQTALEKLAKQPYACFAFFDLMKNEKAWIDFKARDSFTDRVSVLGSAVVYIPREFRQANRLDEDVVHALTLFLNEGIFTIEFKYYNYYLIFSTLPKFNNFLHFNIHFVLLFFHYYYYYYYLLFIIIIIILLVVYYYCYYCYY